MLIAKDLDLTPKVTKTRREKKNKKKLLTLALKLNLHLKKRIPSRLPRP